MNRRISNEVLAGLLFVAIVISLIGTFGVWSGGFLAITGYGTDVDTSTAAFEITGVTDINWSQSALDWGTGYVDLLPGPAELNSNHTNVSCNSDEVLNDTSVPNGTWGCQFGDLALQNIGNEYVNVTIACDHDANTFIGGTVSGPYFQWYFWENASNTCNYLNASGSFEEITINTNQTICTTFNNTQSFDKIYMDVRLVVPNDAFTGARTATFMASAETV